MKKVLHIVLVAGLAMAMLAAKPGPREYANGGVTFGEGTDGTNSAHIAFTAQSRGDDAKGQVEVRVDNADGELVQRYHGVVTCLDVVGNTAIIEGEVTQLDLGTNSNPATGFRIRVQDNGEGANAVPDRIDHRRRNDDGNCDEAPELPNKPIDGGNIQVG